MPSIEFPFRPFRHPLFGMQYRPYALIILQNDSYFFQEYFLVDSGADVTVLPRSFP